MEGYGNENPGAFQSTRPLRGATSDHPWRNLWAWVFQPTRPLRGATRTPIKLRDCFLISTHAPLAGRDRSSIKVTINKRDFNPRAPCGARPIRKGIEEESLSFQPTRPLRGATPSHSLSLLHCYDFNPRAPCGARLLIYTKSQQMQKFQPTRPLRGATPKDHEEQNQRAFQPTRPLRGATVQHTYLINENKNFNPRAPCGARRKKP